MSGKCRQVIIVRAQVSGREGDTLRLGQRVEGGRLDGHVQWFGLQPGVNEEPLKVFEQGRNTVTSVHLQDGCGHSVEDGWEKLEEARDFMETL